jgi:hypothetical protein
MRRLLFLIASLTVLFGVTVPSEGFGQNATGATSPQLNQVAQAREQYAIGVAAGARNDWRAARDAFERAYQLYPQPLTLLNLATALAQTGRLVAAAEDYRAFLRSATTDAARGYVEATQRALSDLERRLPHVTLAIAGLAPGDAVDLDGASVPRASLGAALPVDPGTHRVFVVRGDTHVAESEMTLAEGESRRVELVAPAARAVAPVPIDARRVLATPVRPNPRPSVWASPWLWTFVGVAVVGGAAVTAALLIPREATSPVVGNVMPGTTEVR